MKALERERLAVLEALAAREPRNPAWPLERMRIHARMRDWEPAIEQARRVLALLPDAGGVWIELANLLAGAGRLAEVAAAVEAGVSRAPERPLFRLEAARLLADVGAFEAARVQAAEAARLGAAAGDTMLGRLALWSGDADEAVRFADHSPTLRAAIAVARERWDEAAAQEPIDPEGFVLRAESHVHLGRRADVEPDLDRALAEVDGFLPSAQLVRLLWAASLGDGRPALGRIPMTEIAEVLEELVPGSQALADRPLVEARDALLLALARMYGNRSPTPTRLTEHGPVRLHARTSPRHASRRALELIRIASPARTLAALDEVVARHPASPLPTCHRAELHLWLGDAAQARTDFDLSLKIALQTRFAWIGLGAVTLLEGRPAEALEVLAEGVRQMGSTEGPAVFVYRGEALRRLGRHAEARHDLERAVAARPSRVGAWINLALSLRALGDSTGASAAMAQSQALAPELLEDAARESGEPLEHALVMMRGNRSSTCFTWFLADGRLRAAGARSVGQIQLARDLGS